MNGSKEELLERTKVLYGRPLRGFRIEEKKEEREGKKKEKKEKEEERVAFAPDLCSYPFRFLFCYNSITFDLSVLFCL